MLPLAEFYLISKVVGAAVPVTGALYGTFRWLNAGYQQSKRTGDNITLLLQNHLPHIQATMDAHGEALLGLRSDVRDIVTKISGVEQRSNDTKTAMHTLGEAFVRHLEISVKETRKRTRKV